MPWQMRCGGSRSCRDAVANEMNHFCSEQTGLETQNADSGLLIFGVFGIFIIENRPNTDNH